MAAQGLRETLAAILAADASGYSRLMDGDQHATVAALDAARHVFQQQIQAHRGRLIDTAGDSVLAVFDSAAGAAGVDLRDAALREAEAALAIDPRCSLALQAVAWGQFFHVFLGTASDLAAAWRAGIDAANRAIEIDRGDSTAYAVKAFLLCHYVTASAPQTA